MLRQVVATLTLTAAMVPSTPRDVFAAAGPPYTVLAIHWGAEDFVSAPVVNAAIRRALTSDPNIPIDYFVEYLESDVFDPGIASDSLAEYIRSKYQGRRIDVVVAVADAALRFVLDHRTQLFPAVPIVYSGIAVPPDARHGPGAITGVIRGTAFVQTLEVALRLHPSTTQVFVIATWQDEKSDQAARAALSRFSGRVRLTYMNEPSRVSLIAAVKSVPRGSLILYIRYLQSDAELLAESDEVAPLVAAAATVPVYGTNEQYVGSGVVGGVVRRRYDTGFRIGEMARQIVGGTPADDIPIESARLAPIVDWRQLERWNIDPATLPQESEIRFTPATTWHAYRAYVVAALMIITAQLVLIAGLITQRTQRRRVEQALRANEATLRTSYERTRQLAKGLIDAQESVRAGIARELHDDVCQDLVALSLAICGLKRSARTINSARAQQELSNLQRWAVTLADGVRRRSHDLHPATLGLLGLASAIKGHCIEVRKRHSVDVRFVDEGDLGPVDQRVAVCLFRVAQEALRNGLVHGAARRLVVSLGRFGDMIELNVTDDGSGFDLESVRRSGSGLGLVSIEERAYALGGEVHITSHPGLGTTVHVRVPAAARTSSERWGQSVSTAAAPEAALPALETV